MFHEIREKRILSMLVAAVVALLTLGGTATLADEKPAEVWDALNKRVAVDIGTLEKDWGLKVVALRRSAGGYMLDFRYRVVDREKAMDIVEGRMKPFIVDDARKLLLQIPTAEKVGALRQTHVSPRPEFIYFMMFGNPGKAIQAGDRVTLVIGDIRIDDIVVEG
ncbi:MAG: hypothetical protein OEY16_01985 [Alphaproteobacteria bacterium]|nr:hypothetical protein [Alphaproteobacteria bacterium]